MRKLGYVEEQSLIVQLFSGEGNEERYAVLARDVVQLHPDVIFAVAVPMVLNFKSATTIIPIVAVMSDPVAYGIVSNLSRPTGNITGVSLDVGLEIWGKRIELLKEAIPGLRRASFLGTRGLWESIGGQTIRELARSMGFSLQSALPNGPLQETEYRRLFDSMPQEQVQAVLISDDAENFRNRKLIVDLAEMSRLPTVAPWREFVELGGLIAYSIDLAHIYRHAAR
jgi:putative tryptophan/tyrosine transport system substrate-binding protein